jgi:shikimate kinase
VNLVLTGFMATGKSAVGKILAEKLGWTFYDTDSMIEKETGLTVPEIFAKRGEAPFRDLETQTVRLLSLLDRAVIATGGGVPLREENMAELEKNGWVVCLAAQPETILERVGEKVEDRPLLSDGDPFLKVQKLLRDREKAYARCALRVETDALAPAQVAEKILAEAPAALKAGSERKR